VLKNISFGFEALVLALSLRKKQSSLLCLNGTAFIGAKAHQLRFQT